MLSQIESSKSIPTIATVFKIANGLKIKVDSLLSGKRKQYYEIITINNLSPVIDNHERVYMYCIFPFSPTTGFEVYYCIYKSGCDHESVTHQNAKMEYLTVFQENWSWLLKIVLISWKVERLLSLMQHCLINILIKVKRMLLRRLFKLLKSLWDFLCR